MARHVFVLTTLFISAVIAASSPTPGLEWIRISKDGKGFELAGSRKPWMAWGCNYDHDEQGRLLEDYWVAEWPKVVEDFQEMKALGANVVRIHLQTAKFMDAPDKPNVQALSQLEKLLALAEKTGLYLDLTGLGCYRKADVPAWYQNVNEKERWAIQARCWEAVAGRCAASPAVFCYDLMNEPVSPAGAGKAGEWLPPGAPGFGGFHFVQLISTDNAGRPRPEIARQWIANLVAAIRKHDKRHLITVGLVDWSLDRKGLTSGFVPEKVAADLDFLCVHLYPKAGKVPESIETLKGFSIGKPVVVEETFPLSCSHEEWQQFYQAGKPHAQGWISFYWGKTAEECRRSGKLADAVMASWLDSFKRLAPK